MTQQIVNSYTEWDPLEEVVVGRLAGGVFPTWQPSMRAVLPEKALRDWGFHCIPVDFRHVYTFGGSFHCVTLDIRRRGVLRRYLS